MSSEAFLNPAFDLLLSELVSPKLNSLSYFICVTACLAGPLHSALVLGPSHTGKPPFNSAHEYLIRTVLSNPPLDKDPIQVAKQRCFNIGGSSHQKALLCRINNFTHICLEQRADEAFKLSRDKHFMILRDTVISKGMSF